MIINKNSFYNGNPNIKKAGVKQEYTPEQLDEYIRCKNDPFYFIKNYVKIVSLDEGKVNFNMREYQERMIKNFIENRFSICLTPRQMGKTITVAAFLLHYAFFTPDKSIAILANRGETAREILSRLKRMLEQIPFFLQPGVVEYNKGSVEFGNGSSIMASSTGNNSIRGFTFNVIYLDEFAFVEQDVDFYTSTYPVITSGKKSKVIMTSTPNGMNLFYKIWTESKQNRNSFKSIRVHWRENPNYDDDFKAETIRNTSERQWKQEYECIFYGSSGTLIDGEVLERLTWENPISENDKLKVWEKPIEDHTYLISVDVGEGVGSDYSVIHITDITEMPYRQVCIFRDNKTSPTVLSEITERLAKLYNEAWVIIETNSVGAQVGYYLYHEYEYENVIITRVSNQVNVISGGFGSSQTIDYGLRTTKKSKRIGCTNLKTLIEDNILLIRDFDTISELQTFAQKGQSYEAEDGKFDDIVMSLVVFAWLTTQDYFKDLVNQDMRVKSMEHRMKQVEDDMVPIGFINDGGVEEMNLEYNQEDGYGYVNQVW